MLQAVVLTAALLTASVIYWSHSRGLTYVRTIDDGDPFAYNVFPAASHQILHNQCKWPILSVTEREIQQFIQVKSCIAVQLLIGNDAFSNAKTAAYGEKLPLPANTRIRVPYDSFFVECANASNVVYHNAFVNLADKVRNKQKMNEVSQASAAAPSLAVLLLESTSFAQAVRQLPDTLAFAEENDFVSASMFNQVGADFSENFKATFVDNESGTSIWRTMKKRGCITMSNMELDDAEATIDFDFSAWSKFSSAELSQPSPNNQCLLDGTSKSSAQLKLWRKFSAKFRAVCHHSMVLLPDFEDFPGGGSDSRIRSALEGMKANNLFENTVVVVMSVDGIRKGTFGSTITGRVEERNPFFLIRVPEKFRKEFPAQVFNLQRNANRLITNRDVFKTLNDIATMRFPRLSSPLETSDQFDEGRGMSLLQEKLPAYRSCSDAGVPSHLCLCMDEKTSRSELLTNTSDVFNMLYESMQREILDGQKCTFETTNYAEYPNVQVYALNDMVTKGVTSEQEWKKLRRGPVVPTLEFFELAVRTFAPKPTTSDRNRYFDSLGRFRHYIRENRVERAAPFLILESNEVCHASTVDRYCEMCYDKLMVS